MTGFWQSGTFSQGTESWNNATAGVKITAYAPAILGIVEDELLEPGQSVNLTAAERAKMNRSIPGARTSLDRE